MNDIYELKLKFRKQLRDQKIEKIKIKYIFQIIDIIQILCQKVIFELYMVLHHTNLGDKY